jgi:hypothetical protein
VEVMQDVTGVEAKSRKIFGAVAQLGERRVCTAEVEGSIPFGSTRFWKLARAV